MTVSIAAAVTVLCVAGCDCYGTMAPADGGHDAQPDDAALADASPGCYSGPPETHGVGECREGQPVCEGGQCSGCAGEVLPAGEVCNRLDDDCDGDVDEGAVPICGDACHCVDAGGSAGFDRPSALAANVERAEDGSLVLASGSSVGTWQASYFAYEACSCNLFKQVHPQAELPAGSSLVVTARQWETTEGSPGDWETVGVYPGGPTVEEMSFTGEPAFCSSFFTEVRFELRAAPDGASPRLTCFWLEPLCWLC